MRTQLFFENLVEKPILNYYSHEYELHMVKIYFLLLEQYLM
jgi:hypothetical protein